mmetsp:Transcript_9282/g.23225  ORF Transcript_9282/g.23225 Transcript_9282/m.23225 type:complete len:276 (+) Transcript_9282:2002-2829(+)
MQGHKCDDRGALDVVRRADNRGLHDIQMRDQRGFDLGGADAVARNVENVVHAADDPVVAVLVSPAAITRHVVAVKQTKVRLLEALGVAADGARHAGPRRLEHEVALALAFDFLPPLADQAGNDAKARKGRGPGFHGHTGDGERRDHVAAGLGLPPGVCDGGSGAADDVVVPQPRVAVDGLADCAEDFEGGAGVFRDEFVAGALKGADSGRGGIQLGDVVAVGDVPEAAGVGVGWDALEEDLGGAVEEGPVSEVAVTGDPAAVCGAEEDVAGVVVK